MNTIYRPPITPGSLLFAACAGVAFGAALVAYGHTGNGFVTGPGIFLGVVVLGVVTMSGGIFRALGQRRLGASLLVGVTAAFATMMLLLLVWPYPPPDAPSLG